MSLEEGLSGNDPFAEALRRMAEDAPPEVANDAITAAPALMSLLAALDGDRLAAWLAGLLTVPSLQANADRLEWAVRLALGCGGAGRAPRGRDLHTLLNKAMVEARVQFRDDPVEDFFVAPVLTPWGEFRTFPGRWEDAITSTEDLFAAFLALPDFPRKSDIVVEILSLLKLVDKVIERARLDRREVGNGNPWSHIPLPSEDRLRRLAGRVKMTPSDLSRWRIPASSLACFILHPDDRPALLSQRAGDTPLERRPLIETRTGIVLALPNGVTTAVRSRLITAAIEAGHRAALQRSLFDAQARRIDATGYLWMPPPLRRPDGAMLREAALTLAPDRIVHLVQVGAGLEGWPVAQFGSIVAMDATLQAAIKASIDGIRQWADASHPGAEILTVLILGGWGGARAIDLEPLPHWRWIQISASDLEALTVLEDGSLEDIVRLQEQRERLATLGFDIIDSNGLLNMIAWWRHTEHALIPGGEPSIEAPQSLLVPIEMVLAARQESANLLDPRALPRPHGPHLRAIRLEPHPAAGPPRPLYVATAALAARQLRGAAIAGDECWWIDLEGAAPDELTREIWKTALRWLGIVMTATLGEALAAPSVAITIRLADERPEEMVFDHAEADPWDLRVSEIGDVRGPVLTIGAGWHRATARASNDAEVALAAQLLILAASLRGETLPTAHAAAVALQAAGSPDLRFLHATHADGALGLLAGHGLLQPHRRIPSSAGALLKCGSAFLVRPTDLPRRIEGKGPCLDFLQAYVAAHRQTLLDRVATFERGNLVVAALSRFQSAMNEQRRWRMTASALRAVHGVDADLDASHDVMVHANGTMRAASLLAEIAASQAVLDNGIIPGVMDLDDLLARVLMLFLIEDTVAAIRLDRARPLIGISPAGEVLFEHDFEQKTLRYTSTIRHSEERDQDVSAYASRFDAPPDEAGLDPKLAAALVQEFSSDALALVDMSFAPASLAIEDGGGVTVLRRSALIERLERLEPFAGKSLAPMVTRLTLPSRDGWDDLPPGTSATDFDIARFDRKWSLSARPLIALSRDEDPLVALAPGIVQRAVIMNLGGAMSGSLQNAFWESAAMRRYAGTRGGASGMGFNLEVAAAVRAMGLRAEVEKSLAWCRQSEATPELVALGDVDVLVISPDQRRVWVVEAKELKLCRTLGEAARRLSDYRGLMRPDGKPDKLLKHLRRVAHLRMHVSDLRKTLGLAVDPAVSGVVIVGAPQPMEQAPANFDADAKVLRLADVTVIPWDAGW
jgi:hypothetical protein